MMYKKVYLNILHHNNLFSPKTFQQHALISDCRKTSFLLTEKKVHIIFLQNLQDFTQ